jgi:uncharacterized membrane protein YvbJ
MAIISCPECGKQISDRAAECPQCGCPINVSVVEKKDTNVNSQTKVVVEPKEGCFLQTLNAGCAGCMIIIIIVIILCVVGIYS